jgi:aerobic C4-dicarboxylate transport protein
MPKLFKHLYFWVVVATVIGAGIGEVNPSLGESLKPLGDAFVGLIKIFIGPIVFCTVVTGIANTGDIKKVGRIGIKALFYFEVISTLALMIGWIAVHALEPGKGFNADVRTLDPSIAAQYATQAAEQSTSLFFLHLIPKTFADAFTGQGDLLQILLLAVMVGWALLSVGERGRPFLQWIDSISAILFAIINGIMKLAPLGAAGAMAFTVGKFGIGSLLPLMRLMGTFYLTCGIFILVVLGSIAWGVGFNIFRFLNYIRHEMLIVLATSSSESALVPLMKKLEQLGCPKAIVGLVIPAGYSFNLDGTNIYLTLAALFIAQACNIDLSLRQEFALLAVAVLTSKGASGVTGAGFITLAATLAVIPQVPLAGLALILGVDRFMSEARALTNMIGNGVATLVVAKWEGELNMMDLEKELAK